MSLAAPAKAAPETPTYRWAILVLATLLVGLTAVIWHSFSVFLYTLSQDFGWTRAEVSLAFFIFVVTSGVTGPNAGQLIDRFGAARVVFGGAVILAIGLAMTSRMTELWQFYVGYGLISAIGFSAAGWVPTVTVIQTWFRGRLGTAMGVVSAGAGVGIMVLVPSIQYSINLVGWRNTYLIMAVVSLIFIIPIALFLRTGPFTFGRSSGKAGKAATPAPVDRAVVDSNWVRRTWTLKSALSTRRYWFLFAGVFLTSFASQQVLAHQVAYLRDTGFDAILAASVGGAVGMFSVPAKISWGFLSDRIGREPTYTIGVVLIVFALITLWVVPATGWTWLPYLYAAFIGSGYAVSATLPPVMTSDMFRGAAYGAIFGAVSMASNTGTGVGSWLAGFIFDTTGSYYPAFAIAIVGVLVGGACIWLAGPRKVRLAPGRVRREPIPAGADAVVATPRAAVAEPAAPPARPTPAAAAAPAAWGAWLDARATAEQALAAQLSDWQAHNDDAGLAEVLEIATARSRDRAFRLRRAGATIAVAAAAPLAVPADALISEKLNRLRSLLLAWTEEPVAAPDDAAAFLANLRADTRATLDLIDEERRRLHGTATGPVRKLTAGPLEARAGRRVCWKYLAPPEATGTTILWVLQWPGTRTHWDAGHSRSFLGIESSGAIQAEGSADSVALSPRAPVEASSEVAVSILAGGDLPLVYQVIATGKLAPPRVGDSVTERPETSEAAGTPAATRVNGANGVYSTRYPVRA